MIAGEDTSLRFAFRVSGGSGKLALSDHDFFGWLRVERLELEVPGLEFPIDMTEGPERFQRRRTQVRVASLKVAQRDLDRFVASRGQRLSEIGVDELQARCCDGFLTLSARIRDGAHVADLTFRVYMAGESLQVRFLSSSARVYGFLPTPPPVLAHRLLETLLLDGSDPSLEQGGDLARVVGLGAVELTALSSFLWNTLPAAGWRLPTTRGIRLVAARSTRGSLQISYGPSGGDALPQSIDASGVAQQLARYHAADECMLLGDHDGALRAYRGELAAGGPEQPFVVERLLALATAQPGLFVDAVEMARQALGRWPDFAPAHAALATIAVAQGDTREAANRYYRLWEIADDGGDDEAAARAALAAARLLRTLAPIESTPLYEHVLEHRPGHAEAAEALAERYADEDRWHDSVRLIRARLAGTEHPQRRSRDHLRLAQILSDQLDDPSSAQVELERACELDPDNVAALESLAEVHLGLGAERAALIAMDAAAEGYATREDQRSEARAHARAAEILQRLDDQSGARERFDRALALADEPDALRGAAEIAEAGDRHDDAADLWQRLMNVGGHPPEIYASYSCRLAHSLIASGRSEDAEPHLRRAADQGSPEVASDAFEVLAARHKDSGDLTAATNELAAAVATLIRGGRDYPDRGAALRTRAAELALQRARILESQGEEDGALLDFQRAYTLAIDGAPEIARRAARALVEAARVRQDEDEQRHWLEATLAARPEPAERVDLLLAHAELLRDGAECDPGRHGEALTDIETALALQPEAPKRAKALSIKAWILGARGNREGRARALTERAALAARPVDIARGEAEAAAAWLEADDDDSALAAARRAHNHIGKAKAGEIEDELRERVWSMLGEAAWRRRAWDEVALAYRGLLGSAEMAPPRRAQCGHRLGIALEKRGVYTEAAVALTLVIEQPEAPGEVRTSAWRLLADLYERTGQVHRAAQTLESFAADEAAETTESARADAWYRAGELYRKHDGSGQDAERCLEATLKVVRDHLPALDSLERVKREDGDYERVAVILGRKIAATSRHPGRQKALLGRLASLQAERLHRHDVARETYGRALDIDPDYRPAVRYMAADAEKTGNLATAVELFARLASDMPGDVDLPDDAAALDRERIASARAACTIAARDASLGEPAAVALTNLAELGGGDPDLLRAAADLHRVRKDWLALTSALTQLRAISTGEIAIELDIERAMVISRELGDTAQARELLTEALQQTPDHAGLLEAKQSLDASVDGDDLDNIDGGWEDHPTPVRAPPPVPAAPPSSDDHALIRARQTIEAGKIDEGVQILRSHAEALERADDKSSQRRDVAEVWMELADIYYDRVGDPAAARAAMRQAADAFGQGARRDATLRMLAAEAASSGDDVQATTAYEMVAPERLTPTDRLALAQSYQRLGRDRQGIDILEAARESDDLSDEVASLLFTLHREAKRKADLAAVLERGAAQAPPSSARSRLREALNLYEHALADQEAAERVRARLATIDLATDGDSDSDGDNDSLEAAAEDAVASGDTAMAADLFAQAIQTRARSLAGAGVSLDETGRACLDRLREVARDGNHFEALVRGLMTASAAELDHDRSCKLLREVAAVRRAHLSDPRGAADALGRALVMRPADQSLFIELDSVLRETGDYTHLSSAYELHLHALDGHQRAKPLFELGCIHRDVFNDPDRAGECFIESHEADPSFNEVWLPLAQHHDAHGASTLARPLFALVLDWIELDDEQREELTARTSVLDDQLREMAEGDEEIEEELVAEIPMEDVEPDNERADEELRIAADLASRGQIEAAIDHYEEAASARPDDSVPLEALEQLYAQIGDTDALTELLGRLIVATREPLERGKLWFRRAKLYRDVLRRAPETYRCLKEAHANAPEDGEIAHSLRAIAMARSEWALAAELLYREIAAATSPSEAGALHLELALVYDEKLLDAEQARRNYEDALRLDPESPAAPRPLARLYELSGELAAAARMGELAAERARTDAERGQLLQRAAINAERAGLEDDARRLYSLAAVSVEDDADSRAAQAAVVRLSHGDDSHTELLELRLREADDDERLELLRQLLEGASTSGSSEDSLRWAKQLLEADNTDLSAYLTLKARAVDDHDLVALARLLDTRAAAIGDSTESAALYFELGHLYGDVIDDANAAIHAYEQALGADPEHPAALEALAEIAYKKHDWARALELYERLRPESCTLPADVIALRRGEIAEVLGRENEAMDAFSQAVAHNSGNRAALAALARTSLRQGVLKTAIEASQSLLDLVPSSDVTGLTNARMQLAELCQRSGEAAKAIDYYEMVLSEKPKSLTSLRALTDLYIEVGNHGGAARTLQTLITVAATPSQRAELLYQLGELHRVHAGDHNAASDAYLKGIDLAPTHVLTLRRLIAYYWRLGEDHNVLEIAADLVKQGALITTETDDADLARVLLAAARSGDVGAMGWAAGISQTLGDRSATALATAMLEAAQQQGDDSDHAELAATALRLSKTLESLDFRAIAAAATQLVDRGPHGQALARALAAASVE